MGVFFNISVQLVDGSIRHFVAREDDCWRHLNEITVDVPAVFLSDKIREFQALPKPDKIGWPTERVTIKPSEFPPEELILGHDSAPVGTEVAVEDWDDDCKDLTLRMTAAGWVIL
jgi:hypothetical protein